MTPETIYAKSAKGIQEIETRAHKLGSRLRQALIRIDGIKTVDELVAEAGDLGEAFLTQIEELAKQGFLTDISSDEAVVAPPLANPISDLTVPVRGASLAAVTKPMPEAAPAKPAAAPAPKPAPAPAAAAPAKPAPPKPVESKPHAPAEAVEFNSPVKFKLQDLLVDALGMDTGRAGAALAACRNREDLARWVDVVVGPIETAAGRAKAKTFYKSAKKLVGG